MKNKINNITKMGMLVGLAVITAFCVAQPVRAGNGSAPGKSKHGGSSGGGSSGGGSAGVFYPTVSNVTQLIGDINYADQVGGTFTINLQPNTTFDLDLVTNSTPIIAGNVTIVGNGSTIQREANNPNAYQARLFEVGRGSSLTLEQVTLQNGYVYASYGGAIYNSGTLTISNCTLSANTSFDDSIYLTSLRGGQGGAIYNNGGTVIIESSTLSGNLATGAEPYGGAIYNQSGTVTISNSSVTNNSAFTGGVDPERLPFSEGGGLYNASGSVTISESSLTGNGALYGGGIFNNGTVTVENSSSVTGNSADLGPDVDNGGAVYLDGTSIIDLLYGNAATSF
jgi:hypothetical protein